MIEFIDTPEIYPLIFLSSPLRGNYTYHLDKAGEACKKIIRLGAIPICPHLFYMRCGIIHDRYPEERKLGMQHSQKLLIWAGRMIVIRKENGQISEGCQQEIELAERQKIPYGIVRWDLANLKTALETLMRPCLKY